ncbi:hypothetical protein D3C76_754710 [compost metagenome]
MHCHQVSGRLYVPAYFQVLVRVAFSYGQAVGGNSVEYGEFVHLRLTRRNQVLPGRFPLAIKLRYTPINDLVRQGTRLRCAATEADQVQVDLQILVLVTKRDNGLVGLLDTALATAPGTTLDQGSRCAALMATHPVEVELF